MIDLDAATKQARLLADAADTSPVRQLRYELRRRAREWTAAVTALQDLALCGDEGVIELAGSLSPGMEVFYDHELGHWTPLIRTLQNGGQFSLHFDDPMGRMPGGIYRNLGGPTSPVVVRP